MNERFRDMFEKKYEDLITDMKTDLSDKLDALEEAWYQLAQQLGSEDIDSCPQLADVVYLSDEVRHDICAVIFRYGMGCGLDVGVKTALRIIF